MKEFLQLSELAIGQGIHRVDDQRLNAAAGTSPENLIDDRNDIGKALAGCSSSGQDVVAPLNGPANRIRLMAVQMKWPARIVATGLLVLAENPATFLMKDALAHQSVDRIAWLEGWIQLDQRIWP